MWLPSHCPCCPAVIATINVVSLPSPLLLDQSYQIVIVDEFAVTLPSQSFHCWRVSIPLPSQFCHQKGFRHQVTRVWYHNAAMPPHCHRSIAIEEMFSIAFYIAVLLSSRTLLSHIHCILSSVKEVAKALPLQSLHCQGVRHCIAITVSLSMPHHHAAIAVLQSFEKFAVTLPSKSRSTWRVC